MLSFRCGPLVVQFCRVIFNFRACFSVEVCNLSLQNLFNMTSVMQLLLAHEQQTLAREGRSELNSSEPADGLAETLNLSAAMAKAKSEISTLLPLLKIDSQDLWQKTGHHRRKMIKEVRLHWRKKTCRILLITRV